MTSHDFDHIKTEVARVEARLRQAMLTSSVEELDRLIDDRLVFIGPDTRVYGKEDDLNLHRSGESGFSKIDILETKIEVHGSMAVVMVLADLAGKFRGEVFSSRSRYLRNWATTNGEWRIVSGSVCNVA